MNMYIEMTSQTEQIIFLSMHYANLTKLKVLYILYVSTYPVPYHVQQNTKYSYVQQHLKYIYIVD